MFFNDKEFKNLKFVQLGGGINFILCHAIKEDELHYEDILYVRGTNSLNALADMPTSNPRPVRWRINRLKNKRIKMFACGGYHTLFLCGTKVYGVGYNANGELGTNVGDNSSVTRLKHIQAPIRYIAAGHFHSVFVTTDNNVLCCGCNEGNCLGVGAAYDENAYIKEIVHLTQFDNRVSRVFVGAYHWFVLTNDEKLWMAGKPRYVIEWKILTNCRTTQQEGDIAPENPTTNFVQCNAISVLKDPRNMNIACGQDLNIVYWPLLGNFMCY